MQERGERTSSAATTAEVHALLAELDQRRHLLEHLAHIRHATARRASLEQILAAVCDRTAAQLGGEVMVGVRLVDRHRPSVAPLVASTGIDDHDVPPARRLAPSSAGVSGRALSQQRLVVEEEYRSRIPSEVDPWARSLGVASAMAAPVTRDDEVVGTLVVSATRPRRFSELDREALLAFAEHVSLALNDASATRALTAAIDRSLHQATHDPVTDLPNRALVVERLGPVVARPARRGRATAVLVVGVDGFQGLNDRFGHRGGDAVLVTLASRLTAAVRSGDTVGRLGGGELVVVAGDLDEAELDVLTARVAGAVTEPVTVADEPITVTTSIGIAQVGPGRRPVEVLEDAEVALHRAKSDGGDRVVHFDPRLRAEVVDRSETEQELRQASRRGQLRVHYQPAVWTRAPRAVAVEALVRWERPGRGLVGPSEFLDVAEDTGQIHEIGAWVLADACAQVASWRTHPLLADLRLSANVSARQLADPLFAETVRDVLVDTGLPADALWLEMTEHVLLDEHEDTLTNVLALRASGVHLVIDDFGTGYSSLRYLKRFPVEAIKVDQTFVSGLAEDPGDRAIVASIVRLGEALGLEVVAEGIERPEQAEVLRSLGCELGQGHLYGGAAPADETFEQLLQIGR